MVKALRQPLLKVFPAALLGRMFVIPYNPLNDDMLRSIIRLQLNRVADRLQESQGIPFTYDEEVVNLVASRCTEVESGGRMVDAILTQTMLPEISREFLTRTMEGTPAKGVQVGVKDAKFTYAFS
jgi:type VI secretion system protein VasG